MYSKLRIIIKEEDIIRKYILRKSYSKISSWLSVQNHYFLNNHAKVYKVIWGSYTNSTLPFGNCFNLFKHT